MPRYDNYFRSHMFPGDPRTPLTAAGACTWPTIPAHRYELSTDNAYGILTPLNNTPILIEKVTVGTAHDLCQWNMIAGPPPITFCIVWKRTAANRLSYKWEFSISATACGIIEKQILVQASKCNVDFHIGDMSCPSYHGGTGANFRARQVVFDKTTAPTYP